MFMGVVLSIRAHDQAMGPARCSNSSVEPSVTKLQSSARQKAASTSWNVRMVIGFIVYLLVDMGGLNPPMVRN